MTLSEPLLPPMVKVDASGITADGDDVTLHASAEQVRLGHMINVPVLACYPDGTIRNGNILRITRTGLDWLGRSLPVDLRETGAIE